MKNRYNRPVSLELKTRTFTARNSNISDFLPFQLVLPDIRPPVVTAFMADTSNEVNLPAGTATPEPEVASTFDDVMSRIYAKDPEREKRDKKFHEKMFAGLAKQVKAGTLSRIRFARMKVGLDQRELARRIGTSASHLVVIEKVGANPTMKTLQKIADALSISIKELVGG
jgi:DNA-binding XRE family transcriptional regulator